MKIKQALVVLLICELFTMASQSVAGVTYRDHFDFEERYSHDECNPLYWHPLHMPDHCNKMYENLIRTRLHNTYFYQTKSKQDEETLKRFKQLTKTRSRRTSTESSDKSDDADENCDDPSFIEYDDNSSGTDQSEDEDTGSPEKVYQKNLNEIYAYEIQEEKQNPQPYQVMLNMMKEDVYALPAMPVIGVLPNLGLATIYRQPVSKKTENMIKKMAVSYGSDARDTYMDIASLFYPSYTESQTPDKNSTVVDFENSNTKTIENDSKDHNQLKAGIKKILAPYKNKKSENNNAKGKITDKNKIQTKKIVQGNMVAYIQSQRYQG